MQMLAVDMRMLPLHMMDLDTAVTRIPSLAAASIATRRAAPSPPFINTSVAIFRSSMGATLFVEMPSLREGNR
jgi:hypothetical protein